MSNKFIENRSERTLITKLAVFDLDDTLYQSNSHFSILNQYYHTHFFTSVPIRALGKFFPKVRLWFINLFYQKIPINYRQHFLLPYRRDVLHILEEKRAEGYIAIIVSNAPGDLVKAPAADLKMDYLLAGVNQKANELEKRYKYEKLFVCTDNKTDLDLLSIADEAVLTCRKKDVKFFNRKMASYHCKYKFCLKES